MLLTWGTDVLWKSTHMVKQWKKEKGVSAAVWSWGDCVSHHISVLINLGSTVSPITLLGEVISLINTSVLCSQHSPTNNGGDGALHYGIKTTAHRTGKEQLKTTSQAMTASDIHNCPKITLPSSGTLRSCVSSWTPVTLMNMALLLITFYLAGLLPK